MLRLNPDGCVPSDNPFAGKYVWSYGHRNIAGPGLRLAGPAVGGGVRQLRDGRANLIKKGGNYGWPAVRAPRARCGNTAYIKPVRTSGASTVTRSGLAIVNDTLFMSPARRNGCTGEDQRQRPDTAGLLQGTYGRLRTVEPNRRRAVADHVQIGDKDSTPNNSSTRILQVALN